MYYMQDSRAIVVGDERGWGVRTVCVGRCESGSEEDDK